MTNKTAPPDKDIDQDEDDTYADDLLDELINNLNTHTKKGDEDEKLDTDVDDLDDEE